MDPETQQPPPEPALPLAETRTIPRPSAFGFFGVVLLLFALPGALVQAAAPVLGLLWSEVAALLLPAVAAAAGANLRPSAALLLARRPTPAQASLAFAVGLTAFFVAVPLGNLWLGVLPDQLVQRFDVSRIFDRPPLARAALALVAATVAPFCEEVAFRGYLLTALRARHGPRAAIAIATVLFAGMHLDPVRLPPLLVLGAVFGWLAWRAGSLWPAVIAHATNNGIVAALTVSGVEGSPTAARPDARQALALLLPAVALLAGAVALYRGATPHPPPAGAALEVRDPLDADPRFSARRLPGGLRRAIAMAAALFAFIAAVAVARR